ncbi:MAG: hypothetical protein K2R98_21190 [Gemmataceae bacterium]|nr:hypothetical protein [Gemmataceae bacterium]
MAGLLLCDDLIFTSRIAGTARDLGLSMKTAANVAALQALAQQAPPACIIVDLANPGLKIGEWMNWLREHCRPMPRVVGYGSHVDVETLRRAREAGCDPVLPRSKFVEALPHALSQWMSVPAHD